MKADFVDKNKKFLELSELLTSVQFALDGLHSLGLDPHETAILRDAYPHISSIRSGLDSLFYLHGTTQDQ